MPATASLDYIQYLAEAYLFPTGLRLVVAALVFLVGRAIARALMRGLDRLLVRSKIDASLRKFLGDIGYAVLIVALVIVALDTVGIKTTAVLAVLGAAGLAVGLALQGSLSNFAAGVLLIVLRPYRIGDLVVLGKYLGRVEAIRIFHTVVVTRDNREVIIPNASILGAPIENLTTLGRRRIDLAIGVADPTKLHEVKQLLEGLVRADPRVEASPPPTLEVSEITDVAIKIHLRPWTSTEHYQQVSADLLEKVVSEMEKHQLKFSVTVEQTVA